MSCCGRNRTSTSSSSSEADDDSRTIIGQKVQYRTHLCLIFRYILPDEESYNEAKLLSLFDQFYRQRQSHCEAAMLEDRFVLERSKVNCDEDGPFRHFLLYREIVQLVECGENRSKFFLLYIQTSQGARYYEAFKCKTTSQARQFITYLRQAISDSEFRLKRD